MPPEPAQAVVLGSRSAGTHTLQAAVLARAVCWCGAGGHAPPLRFFGLWSELKFNKVGV